MLGLQSIVEVGTQSSFATANTTQRTSLNVYKLDGGGKESMPADNILGGSLANTSDPTLPAPGLQDHAMSVDVPVCANQLAVWMLAFFGASTDTGSASNYVHTFNSGVAALPINTIQHKLQASDFHQHVGCVGESFDIDLMADREGFAMASMGFMGYDQVSSATTLAGVVTTAPALSRPAQALVNTLYGGVSASGQMMGGKLSFKRKLKRHRQADGTGLPYTVDYDGRSEVSGSVHVRYKDNTLTADQIARTVRTLEFDLLSTASLGVKFICNNIRLERTPVPISGPDGVEYDISFRGWQDATNPALVVKVLNASATVTF